MEEGKIKGLSKKGSPSCYMGGEVTSLDRAVLRHVAVVRHDIPTSIGGLIGDGVDAATAIRPERSARRYRNCRYQRSQYR